MLEAIKYNLAHLVDFTGREDRPTFWWYALFLVILEIVLGLVIGGLMAVDSSTRYFDATQSRPGALPGVIHAQMMQQMRGQMATMMWASGAISLLMIALSLAAFVRRLHDSDNSGWWAAVAVGAQVVAFALSLRMVERMQDMLASVSTTNVATLTEQQMQMSRYGVIGWIAPLVVIVFGVMKSTPDANRYGESPQAG
jgi:uncharacterized membrane protein YhaH (DUF805 family)